MSLSTSLHVNKNDEISTEIRVHHADSACHAFVSFNFSGLPVHVSDAAKARKFADRLVEAAARYEEITSPDTL